MRGLTWRGEGVCERVDMEGGGGTRATRNVE